MEKGAKKGQLQKLSKKHQKAIFLLVYGDMADYMVAGQVDVDPATLSRWKKSPVFAEEFERQLKAAETERKLSYRARANAAAERLFELMHSGNPTVALNACKEVLRLSGDTPDEEVKISGGGVILLPDIKN